MSDLIIIVNQLSKNKFCSSKLRCCSSIASISIEFSWLSISRRSNISLPQILYKFYRIDITRSMCYRLSCSLENLHNASTTRSAFLIDVYSSRAFCSSNLRLRHSCANISLRLDCTFAVSITDYAFYDLNTWKGGRCLLWCYLEFYVSTYCEM